MLFQLFSPYKKKENLHILIMALYELNCVPTLQIHMLKPNTQRDYTWRRDL